MDGLQHIAHTTLRSQRPERSTSIGDEMTFAAPSPLPAGVSLHGVIPAGFSTSALVQSLPGDPRQLQANQPVLNDVDAYNGADQQLAPPVLFVLHLLLLRPQPAPEVLCQGFCKTICGAVARPEAPFGDVHQLLSLGLRLRTVRFYLDNIKLVPTMVVDLLLQPFPKVSMP